MLKARRGKSCAYLLWEVEGLRRMLGGTLSPRRSVTIVTSPPRINPQQCEPTPPSTLRGRTPAPSPAAGWSSDDAATPTPRKDTPQPSSAQRLAGRAQSPASTRRAAAPRAAPRTAPRAATPPASRRATRAAETPGQAARPSQLCCKVKLAVMGIREQEGILGEALSHNLTDEEKAGLLASD
eukprot:Hpha_TRINITY_DN14836_c0_g2::TRINITY_DN14836_c0_g2_i1::g.169895::m.169895